MSTTIHSLFFLLLSAFLFPSHEYGKEAVAPAKCTAASIQQKTTIAKTGVSGIVFKSTDGGQTWEDISDGLPEGVNQGLWRDDFYADEKGLHLRSGKEGVFHNKPNSDVTFWEREDAPHDQGNLVPAKAGMISYTYDDQFLKKKNGTSIWSPMYRNFKDATIRTIVETDGNTVFFGSDRGLFKSVNRGMSWKQVYAEGVMDLVAWNGVLLAPSRGGILRSTDNGDHWKLVISEGGVGIAVECIKGGFAAIAFNTSTQTRRIHFSLDMGKTWNTIDEGLPPSMSIASVKQMGDYLFCGHPNGIYRSSDLGRTWKLLLPRPEEKPDALRFINNTPSSITPAMGKVFNLSVSGTVVYAVLLPAGC